MNLRLEDLIVRLATRGLLPAEHNLQLWQHADNSGWGASVKTPYRAFQAEGHGATLEAALEELMREAGRGADVKPETQNPKPETCLTPRTARMRHVLDLVAAERVRQRTRATDAEDFYLDCADLELTPETKLRVLDQAFTEVATTTYTTALHQSLIALAATAVAWAESLEEA